MTRERTWQLRRIIEQATALLDDETALDGIELFPHWVEGFSYVVNTRIQYNGMLYKCVQAHTSQATWTPDLTPALWAEVSLDEWPEWKQPTGVQDAYMTGDKVSHNNLHWVSDVDNNVWEPGVYGWTQA